MGISQKDSRGLTSSQWGETLSSRGEHTSRQVSGTKYEFDLDGNEERPEDSLSDTEWDGGISESSFVPNLVEHSTRVGDEREAFRLRDYKKYGRCIVLPDDRWKVRWDAFLIG